MLRILAILIACAFPARAEFLWVEMLFGGMECASCSTFIQEKLSKNRNVQSVEMDNGKGLLKVTLKAGTRMRPEQIRDLVQQSGFTPKETRALARGTVTGQAGKWTLTVPEPGQSYPLKATGPLLDRLKESAGKSAEVEIVVSSGDCEVRGVRPAAL